jgi:hypothetical protein
MELFYNYFVFVKSDKLKKMHVKLRYAEYTTLVATQIHLDT